MRVRLGAVGGGVYVHVFVDVSVLCMWVALCKRVFVCGVAVVRCVRDLRPYFSTLSFMRSNADIAFSVPIPESMSFTFVVVCAVRALATYCSIASARVSVSMARP